ncbi:cytochrome P450 [Streptomyces sp. N2-109]|uniref:Cytochrome P450 n=1 Tax=Streptomyces gossypii TaxID=2883101 RepID=A0ABT2JPE1_9ACTN|nr:cytochrome P450 [Streptomyces gossypii]MCT2589757.1 cytochrome P450 [Streptomyces gossypii]
MTSPLHVRRHAEVCAVLRDPYFVVPPAGAGAGDILDGPLGWLRRNVSRFSEGTVHRRRRALSEGLLDGIGPVRLRAEARDRARVAPPEQVPFVPVTVLASRLGWPEERLEEVVRATRAVAGAYQPGATAERAERADDGVRRLVAALPGGWYGDGAGRETEETAQRIGLLVQACEATAGLIRNTLRLKGTSTSRADVPGSARTEDLVAETLRLEPPVRGTRRQALAGAVLAGHGAVPEGTAVLLDFAAANRDPEVFADPDRFNPARPAPPHLTFGHGIRPCPGSAHALALACGVLDDSTPSHSAPSHSAPSHSAPGGKPRMKAMDRFEEFRLLHRAGVPLLLPNAWDHASAAALAGAGFRAVGTTSLGVAAAAGKPDGVGGTREETVRLACALTRLDALISVDIEGGFSERPEQVAALAAELAGAGVVGVNIEDGRADGTLAGQGRQCALIRAVKDAAPALFVNARTDTHWLPGPGHAAQTAGRVAAYQQAGADGVFVPGLQDGPAIAELAAGLEVPLNILHSPTGLSLPALAELGVRRVSCGSLLFRAALGAAVATAEAVERGTSLPAWPGGSTGIPSYAQAQALADEYGAGRP